MKLIQSLIILPAISLVLTSPSYCGEKNEKSPQPVRQIRIESKLDAPLTVPAGRYWRIQELKPYESEKGIGTADLYIDGQILIGSNTAYSISGKFDISINKIQTSAIWILGNSKVKVGDSRQTIVVDEFMELPTGDK